MFITEAIARADALLNNEYTLDEKLHWCDVVNAEICAVPAKEYKKETLMRCADDAFLLPEDCEFIRIEKMLIGGREIEKQDFRTYGIRKVPERMIFIPKNWESMIVRDTGSITVVYLPILRPIRHIELEKEYIDISGNIITMAHDCPFLPGDVVEIEAGSTSARVNILTRTQASSYGEDIPTSVTVNDIFYDLEVAAGELTGLSGGSYDMRRVITDRTLCEAPYDEMYIDYICAQICFYQRKHDIYQQHIARYNARMDEYMRFVRERAPMEDRTVFSNWWRL